MKITLTVECPCGRKATAVAKRHLVENEGRVYEDYSCIEEGFEGNKDFNFHLSHPEGIDITCVCKRKHELTL